MGDSPLRAEGDKKGDHVLMGMNASVSPSWIAPLSCVTEADISVTGPSWQPPPEAVTAVVWCAS